MTTKIFVRSIFFKCAQRTEKYNTCKYYHAWHCNDDKLLLVYLCIAISVLTMAWLCNRFEFSYDFYSILSLFLFRFYFTLVKICIFLKIPDFRTENKDKIILIWWLASSRIFGNVLNKLKNSLVYSYLRSTFIVIILLVKYGLWFP